VIGKYFQKKQISAKYSDLPKNLVQALVATEDERFMNIQVLTEEVL
jgi:penicillin-binding protein 1A